MWIDKSKAEFSGVKPYITNGKTMVPLRQTCELLGAKVSVTGDKNRITASRNGKTYTFTVGRDGVIFKKDTAMIHIRKLAEILQLRLDWIEKYKAVVIETK
jgi:hypothetical protein